jgi:hypothetical protein
VLKVNPTGEVKAAVTKPKATMAFGDLKLKALRHAGV